jgi:4,5-DOPA dioxygenase extradiol
MNAPATAGRLPVAFIGHGSPTNALERNPHTEAWRRFGASVPRPRAVLAVSAHWYLPQLAVTAMDAPPTIHDFFGFPPPLSTFDYPAPGDPGLAARVRTLLQPRAVVPDYKWGLDHGTWSVLTHMFPRADVPVVQLSIDARQPNAFHYDIGRQLAPLRAEGILILGLGNVVHNLRLMHREAHAEPLEWASRFNTLVRESLIKRDDGALVEYQRFGASARLAVPTPDHYLPLLYVLGAADAAQPAAVLTDGVELASMSMLSVSFGAP